MLFLRAFCSAAGEIFADSFRKLSIGQLSANCFLNLRAFRKLLFSIKIFRKLQKSMDFRKILIQTLKKFACGAYFAKEIPHRIVLLNQKNFACGAHFPSKSPSYSTLKLKHFRLRRSFCKVNPHHLELENLIFRR